MEIASAKLRASAAHLWTFSSLLAADPQTSSLNMRHLQLLALVCRNDRGISIGALASLTDRQPYAVSRAIDRLHSHKLIDRVQSSDDRRMTDVTATLAGHELNLRVLTLFDTARNDTAQALPSPMLTD